MIYHIIYKIYSWGNCVWNCLSHRSQWDKPGKKQLFKKKKNEWIVSYKKKPTDLSWSPTWDKPRWTDAVSEMYMIFPSDATTNRKPSRVWKAQWQGRCHFPSARKIYSFAFEKKQNYNYLAKCLLHFAKMPAKGSPDILEYLYEHSLYYMCCIYIWNYI